MILATITIWKIISLITLALIYLGGFVVGLVIHGISKGMCSPNYPPLSIKAFLLVALWPVVLIGILLVGIFSGVVQIWTDYSKPPQSKPHRAKWF